jgi:hypothetical protein
MNICHSVIQTSWDICRDQVISSFASLPIVLTVLNMLPQRELALSMHLHPYAQHFWKIFPHNLRDYRVNVIKPRLLLGLLESNIVSGTSLSSLSELGKDFPQALLLFQLKAEKQPTDKKSSVIHFWFVNKTAIVLSL